MGQGLYQAAASGSGIARSLTSTGWKVAEADRAEPCTENAGSEVICSEYSSDATSQIV